MVPGDWEKTQMEIVKKKGGLSYSLKQHEINLKLAQELGVKPMVAKYVNICTSQCAKIENA